MARELHGKVDGAGLALMARCPELSGWVVHPGYQLSGGEFIKAIHVRAACLKTGARAARGAARDKAGRLCHVCRVPQTLGHVLQRCPMAHGFRVKRHDELSYRLKRGLTKNRWLVESEPRIKVGGTYRKPDLTCVKEGRGIVLDPVVLSDKADLTAEAARKRALYDIPEVRQHVSRQAELAASPGIATVEVFGIASNWRGAWLPASVRILRSMGLSLKFLNYAAVSVLTSSWHAWHAVLHRRTGL